MPTKRIKTSGHSARGIFCKPCFTRTLRIEEVFGIFALDYRALKIDGIIWDWNRYPAIIYRTRLPNVRMKYSKKHFISCYRKSNQRWREEKINGSSLKMI